MYGVSSCFIAKMNRGMNEIILVMISTSNKSIREQFGFKNFFT